MEMELKKNFNGLPFKLFLPKITLKGNHVNITCEFYYTKKTDDDFLLKEAIIKTNRGNIVQSLDIHIKKIQTHVLLDFLIKRKEKHSLVNTRLVLNFLSEDSTMYSVSYKIGKENLCQLYGIEQCEFQDDIVQVFEHVIEENNIKQNSLDVADLKTYKDKVYREMYFLKENGGKRFKVSEGKYITEFNGKFCYEFELETELYIAEETPVVLHISSSQFSGSVLSCEGFKISLIMDTYLSDFVASAYLSANPWRLLEALNRRIDCISTNDTIAQQIIEKKFDQPLDKSIEDIPKGQEYAIASAISQPITFIWGPPGTGKTYTLAQIAMKMLESNKSVLMVSHSNISVDGMILEMLRRMKEEKKTALNNLVKEGKVLRHGYIRSDQLKSYSNVIPFEIALRKEQCLSERYKELKEEKKSSDISSEQKAKIEKEITKLKAVIKQEERNVVSDAKFIATTISKTSIDSIFDDKKFDVVMFDEVSMAYVPHVFSAAAFARKHFICVGDFRQLAPIAQSDARNVLCLDIFRYLNIIDARGTLHYHPWLVMLDVQRRMHPKICEFPKDKFYQNLLKNDLSIEDKVKSIVERGPFEYEPIVLVDICDTYCLTHKNRDNSRFNILSALISFSIAYKAALEGNQSIGIITPYQAQSRLIQCLIHDCKKEIKNRITASTVHQFQGSERDVIIFDCVESYPLSKPGVLMSREDNQSLSRLINVAISRAKGKFIAVANLDYWENVNKSKRGNLLSSLLENCAYTGHYIKNNIADLLVREFLSNSFVSAFKDEEYCSVLIKDIDKAAHEIVISLSDIELDNNCELKVLSALKQARQRGVHVAIKAQHYTKIEKAWKPYTWGSDEELFPLVYIDNSTLWYGVLSEKGMKQDGNRHIFTKTKLAFRITGRKTVDHIQSITDLTKRVSGTIVKPLEEKNESQQQLIINGNKTYDGLGAYVYKNVKCKQCGSPMNLQKNARGRFYLRCSHCNEVTYLEKDTLIAYIQEHHITCPKDGGRLKVILSKTGLYVRCERDHFVNIGEL